MEADKYGLLPLGVYFLSSGYQFCWFRCQRDITKYRFGVATKKLYVYKSETNRLFARLLLILEEIPKVNAPVMLLITRKLSAHNCGQYGTLKLNQKDVCKLYRIQWADFNLKTQNKKWKRKQKGQQYNYYSNSHLKVWCRFKKGFMYKQKPLLIGKGCNKMVG